MPLGLQFLALSSAREAAAAVGGPAAGAAAAAAGAARAPRGGPGFPLEIGYPFCLDVRTAAELDPSVAGLEIDSLAADPLVLAVIFLYWQRTPPGPGSPCAIAHSAADDEQGLGCSAAARGRRVPRAPPPLGGGGA
eukprot:CAMPEP_0194563084 /NCGR_PEP_ID=MMETSP0292-20121207/3283_2 /TAXON_ID=39354 /ORGANISM="Heterosigma akashiwo, Strain CCMP2393" /LENGTH=135 /DNA_ID=CAMNT_0039411947 /DNA_START=356 /DNA_END=764 /DNA_ORIENTATION=-